MNLDEYFPIINNAIPLYFNSAGLITTDRKYHETIYKLTILYYWNRFAQCVRHDKLWSIFTKFQPTKTENFFLFTTDGRPHNAPSSIEYLKRKEQENLLINNQRRIVHHTFPSHSMIIVVVVVAFLFMLFIVFRRSVLGWKWINMG